MHFKDFNSIKRLTVVILSVFISTYLLNNNIPICLKPELRYRAM